MVNWDITDGASTMTDSFIPVVFLTGLVFIQRRNVLVVAHESEFKLLAQFNGVRQRGATDNKTAAFHRWQIFERLDLTHECFFVFSSYLRFEREQNYRLSMLARDMGHSRR